MRKIFILIAVSLFLTACSSNYNNITQEPERPAGAITAGELLENPVYNQEMTVYGEVKYLGDLFCPCFDLDSGNNNLEVWYDLMMEDDTSERTPVQTGHIINGDWIIATGELRSSNTTESKTFWLRSIKII